MLTTVYPVLRVTGETRQRSQHRGLYTHAVTHIIAEQRLACWRWNVYKLPTAGPRRCLILELYNRGVIAWMISAKRNGALATHLFCHALDRYGIRDE